MQQATTIHTPGPWHVGYKPDGDPIDGPNGDYYFDGTVFAPDPEYDCEVIAEGIDSEANAQLIAAAPNLLMAAMRVVVDLDHYREVYGDISGTGQLSAIIDECNAVIAKATGAQP